MIGHSTAIVGFHCPKLRPENTKAAKSLLGHILLASCCYCMYSSHAFYRQPATCNLSINVNSLSIYGIYLNYLVFICNKERSILFILSNSAALLAVPLSAHSHHGLIHLSYDRVSKANVLLRLSRPFLPLIMNRQGNIFWTLRTNTLNKRNY